MPSSTRCVRNHQMTGEDLFMQKYETISKRSSSQIRQPAQMQGCPLLPKLCLTLRKASKEKFAFPDPNNPVRAQASCAAGPPKAGIESCSRHPFAAEISDITERVCGSEHHEALCGYTCFPAAWRPRDLSISPSHNTREGAFSHHAQQKNYMK